MEFDAPVGLWLVARYNDEASDRLSREKKKRKHN